MAQADEMLEEALACGAAGDDPRAERLCREAVRLDPGNARAHSRLAQVLRRMGRLRESAAAQEAAVRLEPDDIMAHLLFFAALHRSGEWERGWAEYEWRTRAEAYRREFAAPQWDGSPLRGKTLLVVGEQGLGDQIHFFRYARLARERCARVVVQCDARLLRLMATCPGVDEAVRLDAAELPPHDAFVWACSLPGIMGTRPGTVPAGVPYLSGDPERAARWRTLFARFGDDLRVGINWEGNVGNAAGRDRIIPLECFHPLARIEGVRLLSLQKGDIAERLANLPADVRLVDLGQHFGDLAGTAAAMEALDLVVTNDTSLAHLAGALGRPVWLALPGDACWRWLDGREDSPWYPTMRIFRQEWTGGWEPVFERIERALRDLVAARARRDPAPDLAACAGGD